ncbi:MAG: alpha/beta hydrolase, partial [Rudaea sp.]
YRIDIPANWNRQLIVFFHGYTLDPVTFPSSEKISPMFDPMLAQGFAVLQSAYSQTGWAVEQASTDTELLRKFFVSKHGKPAKTFVMGMSMGGTLTVMTIEQRADIYAGALSMCGAIEPTDRIMQRDFALRAAFDYYFPNLLGSLVPVPADYRSDDVVVSRISAALASNPKAVRALLGFYGAAEAANLAPIIADVTDDTKELQQRLHGNPFGNDVLIYTGTEDDYALNDGVQRYRGESRAQVALARWHTPNGNLTRPMLELHDTGDPLVPASSTFEYALIAQRAGHGDNFVQQYVNKEGHCVFTPAEIGRAFDELATWVSAGKRPKSGKLP